MAIQPGDVVHLKSDPDHTLTVESLTGVNNEMANCSYFDADGNLTKETIYLSALVKAEE